MTDDNDQRRVSVHALAERMGFSLNESALSDTIETTEELKRTLPDTKSIDSRESVGSMADDPYNSLLEVYDEPQIETDEGPLSGLEVAVKDVIAAKDLRMTCGSRHFDVVPSYDATVVERLLDAGAALVGKSNTDAFAFGPTGEFSEFDDVINPVDPDRVPGGSSSGSAASVAGEVVDGALGSDTGGSVRIPAACCGVVGIKPTHRTTSRYGFVDLAPSTDTIGTFGRDVKTAAKLLDAIRGHDIRDPSSARVSGSVQEQFSSDDSYDLAVLDPFVERCSDAVIEGFETAVVRLDACEAVTVERESFDFGWLDRAYPLFVASEYAWLLRQGGVIRGQGTQYDEEWREIARQYKGALNEHIALRVLPAAVLDDETEGRSYVAAREEMHRFDWHLASWFEQYDALLLPTMRILPPKHGEVTATGGMTNISGNTAPFSMTSHPVTSLPAAKVDDLPVGLQVVAAPFGDATALGVASLFEASS